MMANHGQRQTAGKNKSEVTMRKRNNKREDISALAGFHACPLFWSN